MALFGRGRVFLVSVFAFGTQAAAAGLPLVPGPDVLRTDRSVEAVVLTGASFPQWSAGPEVTLRRPQVLQGNSPLGDSGQDIPYAIEPSECQDQATANDPTTDHSCAQHPDVALYGTTLYAGGNFVPTGLRTGVPIARLLGYRWDSAGNGFVQIPFQVDERFTRYLTNNRSGFAFYSGADEHTTYAFDKENFRFQENGTPGEPGYANPWDPRCDSRPRPDGIVAEADPIPGLDDDDELVFMARDAGERAPSGASLPSGIAEAMEVTVADPLDPTKPRYAYVMRAAEGGPTAAYDATNGYVHYQRDADAGMFVYSQSSYGGYGNAPKGPYCDPLTHSLVTNDDGSPKIEQRRPKDTAWVTTPRYKFRYEGRWLMTEIHVKGDDETEYGPDLIDRWKARAFQQDPSSDTPCCGYEEEDTNWGGSSILLGEKAGPVRVIRETWGADSGTNVIRRETFYRDSINYASYLRVHPIPPLDGIYTQWDYAAGQVSTYYNPMRPDGVAIDGKNDEVLGNLDDPCNANYDAHDHSQIDSTYRSAYKTAGLCDVSPYHQSIDIFDPTHSFAAATLQWEEIAGEHGSFVDRWMINKVTPGGAVQGIFAVPYYRDDSCFDDGTGTSPGPRVHLRGEPELAFVPDLVTGEPTSTPRRCWTPADGLPNDDIQYPGTFNGKPFPKGDLRFYQGDIGAHGLHLLFIAESDNASTTVPLTEIDAQQWQVILPGNPGNVGEIYGRELEKPLVAIALPRPDLK